MCSAPALDIAHCTAAAALKACACALHSRGLKVRMGPGPYFPVGTEIPVIWTIFPGFNGQTAPNRRAAMGDGGACGRWTNKKSDRFAARDLHFTIPTF